MIALRAFLESSAGWLAGKILDVRPEAEFVRGHLSGSIPLPVPAGEKELASIFLPPRHRPLLVVVRDESQARTIGAELSGRGRAVVETLVWNQAACPPEFLKTGATTGYLWEPPLWLSRHESWLPPPSLGPVLDLACGSGRAMVWLAERGYQTQGIDRQPEALSLGEELAASRAVDCEFRSGDLRNLALIPPGPWAVVLNFRYLQRNLLALVPQMLKPAGVALVQTFRDVPGYQGHPHPKHRLSPGELLRFFPTSSFEVLAHESGFDTDGRPVAGIVARRRVGPE